MYLTRLILNPHSRRAQRELAQPYQMHRSLMRAFPDGLDREKERVLFRVETNPRAGALTVLLQSTLEPNWGWLEENGARGYLLRPPETKTFDLNLAPSQTLAFRLRANPTVKHRREKKDGSLRAVRDPLYREEEQIEWLARKGEQNGFHPLRVMVIQEGNQVAWKPQKGNGKRKLTHFAVLFNGLIRVTDPDALWNAVQTGVGPAKSFGFGLLSLGPLSMQTA